MSKSDVTRREFLDTAFAAAAGLYGIRKVGLSSAAPLAGGALPGDQASVCPKSSSPAKVLYAVRIVHLDTLGYHEAHQNQPDERLPLTCLQGLVGRTQPQIYLVYDHYDEMWLNWLKERGDVHDVRWVGTEEIYDRFLSQANALVVTDPQVPGTVNVATMLAGIHNWLPVSPRLLSVFNLKIGMDLRGRWKKDIEAYRWFYSKYGSQLSNRACACLDPAVFELRDYLVEFKIPVVWVSGTEDVSTSHTASPAEEEQFARDLLLKMPANIPCLGWWGNGQGSEFGIGEGPGVTLANQYAKFEVCSAWDGWAHPVSNFSVHSGTRGTFRQRVLPPPRLEKKVYWTYTRTDGDGPNFWRHVYRHLWDEPDHGKVPVGWQLGPTAYDLIPDIIDYFYQHATDNDVFVNALTGIGYIHENQYATKLPEPERKVAWDHYMRLSDRYFKLFDFSLLTTYQEMRPELMERFATLPAIQGIFANYARSKETTLQNVVTEVKGVPVFRAVAGSGNPLDTRVGIERAVSAIIRDIRRFTPRHRPAFLQVSLTNWAVKMKALVKIREALGSDYMLVRPDQLAALYHQNPLKLG
jgi:GxGYxYP putative glycoside hydrolase C-terminal domain/GxGYxYP_N second domain/GxGYxYP third domain/GxGYxYP_N 1st domain